MYEDEDDALAELHASASHRLRRRDRKHTRRKKKGPDDNAAPTAARDAPTVGGLVIEAGPGTATVAVPAGDLLHCVLDARLRRRRQGALVVGDEVVVARDPSGVDLVIRVAPRRTQLARRSTQNHRAEQILVANIDVVGIVATATDPPLRPRLVDRYLLAIRRGGPRAVLLINKVDQADEARRREVRALTDPYRAVDVPVHFVSAVSREGLDELRQELAGERCAFVGHSGVGKSTLVNALGASTAEGALAAHGRGRHTTTTATLHVLPTEGGVVEIIDTPGIRQLGLVGLTAAELRDAFPELAALAGGCRYSNCTHSGEADCAVQEARERGELSEARYDSYVRLLAHT